MNRCEWRDTYYKLNPFRRLYLSLIRYCYSELRAQNSIQCEWVGIDVLMVDLIIRGRSWQVNCKFVDESDVPEEITSSLADSIAQRTTEDQCILFVLLSPVPHKLGFMEKRRMLLRASRDGTLELESPWIWWREAPSIDWWDRTWRQKCMAKFRLLEKRIRFKR